MQQKYYQKSKNECMQQFAVGCDGLSESEVTKRSAESQKKLIKSAKKQSIFVKFLLQLKDLMVVVLLVSGVISIIIGIVEDGVGEIVDGSIILGIVVMNALFGVYQERKSEKAIDSLRKMSQPETFVVREGKLCKIKTSDVVFGDIVNLSAGSIVPADLRLIESVNLKINESALTGESEPVSKDCDVIFDKEIALGDQKNMAFAGSVVEGGHAKGVVVALGSDSELGKIAESLKETKKQLTPLQKSIQGVGKVLTYLVLLVASVTFVLEVIANPNEILQAFLTAVAISVAAIPESMPAVITIIMSLGIAKLSKQKAIVKRMHAVETLGACDVVCSDKTGTITQNKMNVEKTFMFFDKNSQFFDTFCKCMTLCNDAAVGDGGYVGSSTEVALANYAKLQGYEKSDLDKRFARMAEISFSSQRKLMTTMNVVDDKKVCYMKGALDRVFKNCDRCVVDGKIVALDESLKKKIEKQNSQMCKDALRVISFAFKDVDCQEIKEEKFVFLGLCGIQDPPRKEVASAVEKCKSAGLRTVMITGDYKETAFSIARQVGIAHDLSQVVSGEEIDMCNDQDFLRMVETKNVFARVGPAHKVRIVQALKQNGHIVSMTGDGVNDAPSLKAADIGLGMGISGTDVAKEVADVIVTDDNFATIVVAVEEGRKIYSNIQKTIKYLFSANMAEILALFFVTILCPGLTFLLPVQILFVNLITDSLPAIALGIEQVEKGIMKDPPRSKVASLFSNGVGASIVVLGAVQTILTMVAYFFGYFTGGEPVAITMAFYTLNFIQLFYMFTARTNENCFKSNPFKNKFFNLSLVVGFGLLTLIATTGLSDMLKLTKLDWLCWLVVIVLSVSIIFIGELFKVVSKKINKKLHFK